jgi:NADP-dependent 3-hydroxy acid dehydrogenase YdfG
MEKPLVVITGASAGIGAETAKLFAAAGHPLLLLARRNAAMKRLNLPHTIIEKVDVRDAKAVTAAIRKAEKQYGKVDCLVNNAGVMINSVSWKGNPADWKSMVDVNILGLMNGIKAVLGDMVRRETGSIINIGSIAGIKTFGSHAVYCGTKFAVHAITETIREEVSGSNVRLINVAPGMTETDLIKGTKDKAAREGWLAYAQQIGGALKPEAIAQTILWSYQMPQSVCVREVVVCPTRQEP